MKQVDELIRIANLAWHEDEYGYYWTADMLDSPGVTGTFYNFELNGKRKSLEDQQLDIEAMYEVK